jgi:LacI family transcriptional regulator
VLSRRGQYQQRPDEGLQLARITLSTIAKKTGLSKFAVSRALSGKSGVSEETRQYVQSVAAELGYLRPVQGNTPNVLGIVFHDTDLVNSELQVLVQSGFQAEATLRGYQARMIWTHLPEEVEAFARTCMGISLVGPHLKESKYRIRELGIPLSLNGWIDPLERFDMVHGTDHESGAAVANYLIGLGHRRIAYVQGSANYRGRVERFYGLREVVEQHPEVELRLLTFDAEKLFMQRFRELLDEGFEPTAFFCAHDGLALTAMSELMGVGYKIPQDATVIGFGDFSAATQITPNLTTVKTQGHEIGAGLARMLDDRIHERMSPGVPIRMMLCGHLVERQSSGPAPNSPGTAARLAEAD